MTFMSDIKNYAREVLIKMIDTVMLTYKRPNTIKLISELNEILKI